jgi:AraC-like DNA-binding protein
MSFASRVIHLTDDFNSEDFPARFSNQVYYSCLSQFTPFSYRSIFSIKLTLQGSESYAVNHHHIRLSPGQLLVVNDGSEVEGLGTSATSLSRGLSFFIESDLLAEIHSGRQWLTRNEIPEGPILGQPIDFDERPFVDETLSNSLSLFTGRNALEPADYVSIGEVLLDHRFRFEDNLQRTQKVKRSTQLEIFRRVNTAQAFLNDSACLPFNLDDVARAACMSKFLLIRCFKNLVGTTPQQYHQRKRMEAAKQLLRCGHSVTETSRQLGFGNIHYFSRHFKKVAGHSPRQWRRQDSLGY